MRIGVPAEVKPGEGRVALTPAGVRELVRRDHPVYVQAGAGAGSRLSDEQYAAQGATIVSHADGVVRRRGADRQGQGAPGTGGGAPGAAPRALHVPSPGG
jgi:hypothetical protein